MTVTTLMGEMYVRGAIWGGAPICAVRVYRGRSAGRFDGWQYCILCYFISSISVTDMMANCMFCVFVEKQ